MVCDTVAEVVGVPVVHTDDNFFDLGGHYGGRLIWQLKDAENLFICWKEFSEKNDDPKKIKQALINQFKKIHDGKLPFANLR